MEKQAKGKASILCFYYSNKQVMHSNKNGYFKDQASRGMI
jgi:hypothetical protein